MVEQINSAIETFKSTMKALKITAIGLLAGAGGYVVNEATHPEPVVVEQQVPEGKEKPMDLAIKAPAETDEGELIPIEEVGAKPLILYRVYFGWDYPVMIPEEVVPITISGPGRPSYEAEVRIPGYSTSVPAENTVFEVASRSGEPDEKEALRVIRRRGEKLIPPRDGCTYAGLVRVEPVRVISMKEVR